MSEVEKEKKLLGITPTFQTVLNTQLKKFMDALDYGDLFTAYVILKTLIDALRPTDREALLCNDVSHIDKQILKAMQIKDVDLYTTRRVRKATVKRIIRENIRGLFRKVMTKLHEGGYLEKTKEFPKRSYR